MTYFLKRPLSVNLLSLVMAVLGLLALGDLPSQLYPTVTFPEFRITTSYPFADIGTVEQRVTVPLEKELKNLPALQKMNSVSEEGRSQISLTMDADLQDLGRIYQDIQQAVDRAAPWPQDVKRPSVVQVTTVEPILTVVCYGDGPYRDLYKAAHAAKTQLENISGVEKIETKGLVDPEIMVQVDPQKMIERGLQIEQISQSIQMANQATAGTTAVTDQANVPIRLQEGFLHPQDISGIIVRSNRQGHKVKVGDVAVVQETFPALPALLRMKGSPRSDLVVFPLSSADTIGLVRQIRSKLQELAKTFPSGIKVEITKDHSEEVSRRLRMLQSNIVWGALLVVLVLLPLMKLRAIIQLLWGIPFAVLGTFLMMRLTGMTLNIVSLVGLIMAIGMVVDGALMVSEEIQYHSDQGLEFPKAVLIAIREMFPEVLSTILTTIIALAPLWFMKGYIGEMLGDIPTVMSFVLLFSLVEAFVVLPIQLTIISRWRWVLSWEKKLTPVYEKLSRLSQGVSWWARRQLPYRYGIFASLMLAGVATVMMTSRMNFYMFRQSWLSEFYIKLQSPETATLAEIDQEVKKVEDFVARWAPSEIVDTMTTITRDDPTYCQIDIHLLPLDQQKRFSRSLMAALAKDLEVFTFFRHIQVDSNVGWARSTPGVQIQAKMNDLVSLKTILDSLKSQALLIPGVKAVQNDLEGDRQNITVHVDPGEARKVGLANDSISQALQAAFRGLQITELVNASVPMNVFLTLGQKQSPEERLRQLVLGTPSGDYIPLSKVARLERSVIPRKITHEQGVRVASISIDLDENMLTPTALVKNLEPVMQELRARFPASMVGLAGARQEEDVALSDFVKVAWVAFLLVFVIVSLLFQSMGEILLVFATVVFGVMGGTWALYAHLEDWGFMAFLGLLSLLGVVVDNAIILIATSKVLERSGVPIPEAMAQACARKLKPIVFTILTTFVGTIPMAYGWGGRDNILSPLGLVFSWGLLFSTGLTVALLPSCYMILQDIRSLALRGFKWRGKNEKRVASF